MLSYSEMEIKYGAVVAYQYLTEIEKAAHISPASLTGVDPETRLAEAIYAQDCVSASKSPE